MYEPKPKVYVLVRGKYDMRRKKPEIITEVFEVFTCEEDAFSRYQYLNMTEQESDFHYSLIETVLI